MKQLLSGALAGSPVRPLARLRLVVERHRARVAVSRPRRQEQQQARVRGRGHLVRLVGIELGEEAGPAAGALTLGRRDLQLPLAG